MSHNLGPAVVNGAPRYTSPSAISTFDPETYGGCNRKWWFRYVKRVKTPTTKPQQTGLDGHGRIEHHLKTGENVLTDMERPGRIWIPTERRLNGLWIEPEIDVANPITVIAGVPLVGKLDLLDGTGVYIDPQGEAREQTEPEVDDWKFSGDPRGYGKTADQIRDDLAMNAYALWVLTRIPGVDRVRLSHVYFCTRKPDAFKRTAIVTADHATAIVQAREPVVERMKAVAACTDVSQVPCNLKSCKTYGRDGCPYQNQCDRPIEDVIRLALQKPRSNKQEEKDLMALVEATDAPSMADRLAKLQEDETAERKAAAPPVDVDALLCQIKLYNIGSPEYVGEAAAAYAAVMRYNDAALGYCGSGQLAKLRIETVDEMVGLVAELTTKWPDPSKAAAELAAAKGAQAPAAAPTPAAQPQGQTSVAAAPPVTAPPSPDAPPQTLPPDSQEPSLAQAAAPLGPEETLTLDPAIQTEAATQKAAADAAAAATTDTGKKKKGKDRFTSMKVAALREECRRLEAAGAPASDGTPISSTAVDTYEAKLAEAHRQLEDYAGQISALKGAAQRAMAVQAGTVTQVEYDTLAQQLAAAEAKLATPANLNPTSDAPPAPQRLEVWADCTPTGVPEYTLLSLDSYVDAMCADVAKVGEAIHIQCVSNDSAIGYGKWKGYLATAVKDRPPQPGCYSLRVQGDEVRAIVADALRAVATVHRGL